MTVTLHQKGANGLIAEYECAYRLNELLKLAGIKVRADSGSLVAARDETVARVANELEEAQIRRAFKQGEALSKHILDGICLDPSILGLNELSPAELKLSEILIATVGNQTNSGNSADIVFDFFWPDDRASVPVSLKAYGERPASLGSKGLRASLTRIFLGKSKVADAEFLSYFGAPAQEYLGLLEDFKLAAKEFYGSEEGSEFIAAYRIRKGDPSAKVNNPLRRKEVGQYFARTRGIVSEHKFAELYVQLFEVGSARMSGADDEAWESFFVGLRFVLGMDDDILTLNAIAGENGDVLRVENSFLTDAYAQVRRVLVPGVEVALTHSPGSSIVGVSLVHESTVVRCLSLAIWKDATIQFKLDTRSS